MPFKNSYTYSPLDGAPGPGKGRSGASEKQVKVNDSLVVYLHEHRNYIYGLGC